MRLATYICRIYGDDIYRQRLLFHYATMNTTEGFNSTSVAVSSICGQHERFKYINNIVGIRRRTNLVALYTIEHTHALRIALRVSAAKVQPVTAKRGRKCQRKLFASKGKTR